MVSLRSNYRLFFESNSYFSLGNDLILQCIRKEGIEPNGVRLGGGCGCPAEEATCKAGPCGASGLWDNMASCAAGSA